jgi:ArsR family transcriptional regulator, arsenate/arsenite/antimonite-responsive transcriptional repressor
VATMLDRPASARPLGAPAGQAPPAGDVAPAAARLLKLLADPTRRRIFLALMRGETCNCELTDELGLAQNLISHHMRALREASLVVERRDQCDARWIYYRIDVDALAGAWAALADALDPARVGTRAAQCGPSGRVETVPGDGPR